eukprot:SAG25_NODE_1158_length_3743_cov_2.497256_2_plen_201_part_00
MTPYGTAGVRSPQHLVQRSDPSAVPQLRLGAARSPPRAGLGGGAGGGGAAEAGKKKQLRPSHSFSKLDRDNISFQARARRTTVSSSRKAPSWSRILFTASCCGRQLRITCRRCLLLASVVVLMVMFLPIFGPFGAWVVLHNELLTEWRLGRSGSHHILAGPVSLLTGDDEWQVVFVTRCPPHECSVRRASCAAHLRTGPA